MSVNWVKVARRSMMLSAAGVAAGLLVVFTWTHGANRKTGEAEESLAPLLFVRGDDVWIGEAGQQRRLIREASLPAWSRDRRQIAFVRGRNVWIASADGQHQKQLTRFADQTDDPEAGSPLELTWHPRGDMIAFEKVDRYRVQRVGEKEGMVQGEDEIVWWHDAPECLDLSNIYVFLLRDIHVFGYPPRRTLLWLNNGTGGLLDLSLCTTGSPCFSPDGQKVAFSRNGDLWMARVWDLEKEYIFWRWDEERYAAVAHCDSGPGDREPVGVCHISWSPDGKWLAYDLRRLNGSGTEEVWIVSASDPSVRRNLAGGWHPSFDPTGKWIAYWSRGGPKDTDGGIWYVSLDGRGEKLLVRDAYCPSW